MTGLPVEYGYLFFTSLFLVPWAILFLLRRDLRHEMLTMSIFFALIGILGEGLWYTIDWVNPETIVGMPVGPEDIILGFGAAGVAAVVYEEVFKKHYAQSPKKVNLLTHFLIPLLLFVGVTSGAFWILNLHSFEANIIGFASALTYGYLLRPDLITNSLISGLLLTLISVPAYLISLRVFPDLKESYWQLENLSGIELLNVPIEDFIWWMGAGALIGPFYEFWHELRTSQTS